jgi:hypothetical protein
VKRSGHGEVATEKTTQGTAENPVLTGVAGMARIGAGNSGPDLARAALAWPISRLRWGPVPRDAPRIAGGKKPLDWRAFVPSPRAAALRP